MRPRPSQSGEDATTPAWLAASEPTSETCHVTARWRAPPRTWQRRRRKQAAFAQIRGLYEVRSGHVTVPG